MRHTRSWSIRASLPGSSRGSQKLRTKPHLETVRAADPELTGRGQTPLPHDGGKSGRRSYAVSAASPSGRPLLETLGAVWCCVVRDELCVLRDDETGRGRWFRQVAVCPGVPCTEYALPSCYCPLSVLVDPAPASSVRSVTLCPLSVPVDPTPASSVLRECQVEVLLGPASLCEPK